MIETIEKTDDLGNTIKIVYTSDDNKCRVYDENLVLGLEFDFFETFKEMYLICTNINECEKVIKAEYSKLYNYIKYVNDKLIFYKNYIYNYNNKCLYDYKLMKNIDIDLNIINIAKNNDIYFLQDDYKIYDKKTLNLIYEHFSIIIDVLDINQYIIYQHNDGCFYLYDYKNKKDISKIFYDSKEYCITNLCTSDKLFVLFVDDNHILLYDKANTKLYNNTININKDIIKNNLVHYLKNDENNFLFIFNNHANDGYTTSNEYPLYYFKIFDIHNNILYENYIKTDFTTTRNEIILYLENDQHITLNVKDLIDESIKQQNLKLLFTEINN